jgi:23S rRNA pseudouridine2605 synthase
MAANRPPHNQPPVETDRVAKVLARAGVASRREIERLIEAGRIAVNGQVLTTPAVKIEPGDILTFDGEVVAEAEPTRLFRYHKPVGLVTTHVDPKDRPTVFKALPPGLPRVISIGRLDLSSEGLLLLTNDGGLARALEMPSNGWIRRYRARAFGATTQETLDKLKDGVTVEGVHYGSIEAKLDKASGRNVWITVTLSEGKNREVRRVLESIGLKVNRLIRIAYGPFALGELAAGGIEEVGPRVIRELLTSHIAPANLPKGDKVAFKPFSPGPSRRDPTVAEAARKAAAPKEEVKMVYKAGWAKPKKKVKPAGWKTPEKKPRAERPERSASSAPPRTSAARPPARPTKGGPKRRG